MDKENSHAYYIYGMTLDLEVLKVNRETIIQALEAEGIEGLTNGYQNIHLLPMYQNKIAYGKNYENLRYEGFGPFNIAFIIETLTDNKNRSASSIRTVLQKNGGRLGESGSTAHYFFSCGVIQMEKKIFFR
mgnify:CR=1 FL=1